MKNIMSYFVKNRRHAQDSREYPASNLRRPDVVTILASITLVMMFEDQS